MTKEPSRLTIAVADPSSFGQAVLADLLLDEGVRRVLKFSSGRDLLAAMIREPFDLIVMDDAIVDLSALEILALAKASCDKIPAFITLQSVLDRSETLFFRENGITGVLAKPDAPKRFSHVFRKLFRSPDMAELAA